MIHSSKLMRQLRSLFYPVWFWSHPNWHNTPIRGHCVFFLPLELFLELLRCNNCRDNWKSKRRPLQPRTMSFTWMVVIHGVSHNTRDHEYPDSPFPNSIRHHSKGCLISLNCLLNFIAFTSGFATTIFLLKGRLIEFAFYVLCVKR